MLPSSNLNDFILRIRFNRFDIRRYLEGIKNGEPIGILTRMSVETGLSPALLARIILENHWKENNLNCNTFLLFFFIIIITIQNLFIRINFIALFSFQIRVN